MAWKFLYIHEWGLMQSHRLCMIVSKYGYNDNKGLSVMNSTDCHFIDYIVSHEC